MEAQTTDGLWAFGINDEDEVEPNTLSVWYKTRYGYLNVANIDINKVHEVLQVNDLLPDGAAEVADHDRRWAARDNRE